jgi:AraC family transcriptional regulator
MPSIHASRAGLGLGYLHGGLATYLPGETLGPRFSRDYELVWIIGGRVTYHLGERDYDAPPGAIILSRPGFHERYTWDPRRQTRHAYFHFTILSRPSDWADESSWPVCRVMPLGDPVRPLFRHVVDVWCQGFGRTRIQPPFPISRAVATLIDCLLQSREEHDADKPARRYSEAVQLGLSWVQSVLLDQPDRPIHLAELAKAAGVSPQHLCRLFAEGPGIGPMHAVRLLRLEQAAALLARSTLNVKQIAARCGFASQFHFSRVFRAVYGASPSEVRAQAAQGAPPPVPRLALELPHVQRW